jgi:hypothetical protein
MKHDGGPVVQMHASHMVVAHHTRNIDAHACKHACDKGPASVHKCLQMPCAEVFANSCDTIINRHAPCVQCGAAQQRTQRSACHYFIPLVQPNAVVRELSTGMLQAMAQCTQLATPCVRPLSSCDYCSAIYSIS